MAQILAERGAIPPEVIDPTRQIVSVCNQAIHGYDVSDDLADAVVASGEDLIARLRQYAEHGTTGATRTKSL